MTIDKAVIIVAGGSGKRMGGETPKQFLLLNGRPILMHTIDVFFRYCANIQIIVVLPELQVEEWIRLVLKHQFTIAHQTTTGGEERYNSVKNGLQLVENGSITAIHDGVRPMVSLNTIERCFELAQSKGSAVPVVEVFESIRVITSQSNRAVSRGDYRLVQTPQVFDYKTLKESYNLPFSPTFTDDASVVEAAGYQIFLTEGNRENIKVTTPIDLKIAEALLQSI